jgi:hypothetical protein
MNDFVKLLLIILFIFSIYLLFRAFFERKSSMKPTNLNIIKNSLAIITIFKDESQSIFEWLLHHALEGVTQFVLLNNESRDKFREQILLFQKYWDKFIENKSEYSQVLIDIIESPGKYEQVSKLQKHTHLIKTQWYLSIDLDEFVYSRKGFKKITDYLDTCYCCARVNYWTC